MDKEERRRQIIESATRLFAEGGYHDTQISTIAEDLSIGHGTFYRYFENKLDIFGHVIDAVVGRLASAVIGERPDAATTALEYREQVERIGRRLFDLFTKDERLASLLFVQSVGVDPGISMRVDGAMQALATVTEAYLRNGVKRGFLRADLDTEVTARAINQLILAAVPPVLRAQNRERERDRWIAAATALIFDGITAREAP